MSALNITDVAAYRDFVQRYADDLLDKVIHGFPTAQIVDAIGGIKGRYTMTQFEIQDLAQRYDENFNPLADRMSFAPVHLDVVDYKVDLKIVPKKFERSYLGYLRKTGQTSMDLPFQAFILRKIISKLLKEKEIAFWQGEAAAVPAAGQTLVQLFDGIHKQINAAQVAGNLTPVATGALTNANAINAVETMYKELSNDYLTEEVGIFMSMKDKFKLEEDYRTRYGANAKAFGGNTGANGLDISSNSVFHFLPGVKDGTIFIAPSAIIKHGYDGEGDDSKINMEQQDRSLKLWIDAKMGNVLAWQDDAVMVTNDQH